MYFQSFKGQNLPRVTYRKFAKAIADCTNDAQRSQLIEDFCKSIAELQLVGDWNKMKLFPPEYLRTVLRQGEMAKIEETFAQKRRRRNEKLLEVYPHCSDEFSTRIEFLDAVFGSQRYGILTPATKIFTIGSCFALNIAKYLQSKKFAVEYFGQAEDLNSPFSNAKMLSVCAADPASRKAYIEHWVKLLHSQDQQKSVEAHVEEELKRLDKLAASIKAAEFLVVTFGNVLDYFLTKTDSGGIEIGPAVAPKFLSIASEEDVHLRAQLTRKLKEVGSEFRLGTYAESREAIEVLYSALRRLNPEATLLFTLSPVPIANAIGIAHTGKLGAIELDSVSKSLLRVALSELMQKQKSDTKLYYFQSFEIVRWVAPCIDAAVLGREDGSARHVSDHIINGVYEYFLHKFGNAEVEAARTGYSRANPSPRYRELVAMYQQMHEQGDASRQSTAEETFQGVSLAPQAERIRIMIHHTAAKTLLDYGCGKGLLYRNPVTIEGKTYPSIAHAWGVSATLYDPAYAPYATLPQGKFDGVICTDVLEHCPEEDIPWILDELFSHASRFVFANIAAYPALRKLPNGDNVHCTIQPPSWWQQQIERAAASYPNVECRFIVTDALRDANGQPALDANGKNIKKEHVVERMRKKAA